MIVRAPGKLLLTGAYAVLEGAPAVVAAVARYALAGPSAVDVVGAGPSAVDVVGAGPSAVDVVGAGPSAVDVVGAGPSAVDVVGAGPSAVDVVGAGPSAVDTRALYEGGTKLGLGSSAAAIVAARGLAAAMRGEDLGARAVRDRIFTEARAAHAREQSGGSGVDVAASTYGGVLVYDLATGARAVKLPPRASIEALFSGTSARTSDLLAQVRALRARDPGRHAACMAELASAARAGAAAVDAGDLRAFVEAARATLRGLSGLGRAADAPIVPPAFAALGRAAEEEGAAFLPSGAGGGDVGVVVGAGPLPPGVFRRALELGFRPLAIAIDADGLRVVRAEEV